MNFGLMIAGGIIGRFFEEGTGTLASLHLKGEGDWK
jgi:hypothetical protein